MYEYLNQFLGGDRLSSIIHADIRLAKNNKSDLYSARLDELQQD